MNSKTSPAEEGLPLPRHVAIIMDGNGRWAQMRHLPRVEGHRRGVASVDACAQAAREMGIRALTLFAFSSENWKRPKDEVSALMALFVRVLRAQRERFVASGIRLRIAGDVSAFSDELRNVIAETEAATSECTGMDLVVCANYGGRWDIAQAMRSILKEEPLAARHPEMIDEELIGRHLALPWSGDVDLMIRTGGEFRLSNFLLWQAAYAELYFTPELWPDFTAESLERAVRWYQGRERRFGLTSEQVCAARRAPC